MVMSTPGRSGKPGGLSQMGYACFWPKGGGLQEGGSSSTNNNNTNDGDSPEMPGTENTETVGDVDE